jgi:hypothetical protein
LTARTDKGNGRFLGMTGNGKDGKAKTKYRGLSTSAAKAAPSVEIT